MAPDAKAAERNSPWRVKYDGPCVLCGATMLKGTVAVWDRSTKTMRHMECRAADEPIGDEPIEAGTAGASTQREYERRLAKDRAQTKEKWGRFAGIVEAWNGERQSTQAWAIGAAGEEVVAKALATLRGVHVLHDRRVPKTLANLDHLVIGPAGVFIADAKNHSGTVSIRDKGSFVRSDRRLYVGSRDNTKLAEGMGWQVEAVASAFHSAAINPLPDITPVLCFASADWPLLFPPDEFNGVRLESPKTLKELVTKRQVLEEATVDRYVRLLATAFPPK